MSAARIRRRISRRTAAPEGRPDYLLVGIMAILLIVGLQAVYSSSYVQALSEYDSATYFLSRQAMWSVVGVVALAVMMRIDFQVWKPWSPLLMVGCLLGLMAVLMPGVGVNLNGAARWFALPGPLPPVQPSEFTKLALILYLAAWLSGRRERLRGLSTGVLPFVITVGAVAFLVMRQPDLGTTLILMGIAMSLFFLSGAGLHYLLLLVSAAGGGGLLLVLTEPYRFQRWLSFTQAEQDPTGTGFHILQSLIALGSGGLFGLGPGASRQKFFYLPGAHTDSIFAIIGEELGFIGAVAVIILFIAFVYRGFKIAYQVRDEFGSLVAAGITSWFAIQTLLNLGGITRSIPLTGVPLPFISYGGSALAISMAAVGVLLNISMHREQAARPAAGRVRAVARAAI